MPVKRGKRHLTIILEAKGMEKMLFNIIGLAIGILLLIAGVIYLIKEKEDQDARKIYMITALIGAVVTIFMVFRLL